MKHVTIAGGKHPAWVGDVDLCVGGDRRNTVMHIAKPDVHRESYCGRGGVRAIDRQPDFAYTICGDCIERAILKVEPEPALTPPGVAP